MATATRAQRKFYSRPYTKRPGFVPSAIGLLVGWSLVLAWFTAAVLHYKQYSILGYFEFLMALGFTAFTAFMTWSVIHEGRLAQELVVDNDTISLSTRDKNNKTTVTRTLAFKDIVRAEHYKASDSNSIVLRSKTHDLEIPTWCFDHATDYALVELLLEHGIEVLGVPIDIKRELQLHGRR